MSGRLMVNMSIIPDAQEREVMRSLLRHQIPQTVAAGRLDGGQQRLTELLTLLATTQRPLDESIVNRPERESAAAEASRIEASFRAFDELFSMDFDVTDEED